MAAKRNLSAVSFDGVSRLWRSNSKNDFVREWYSDAQPAADVHLPLLVNVAHEEHCRGEYYRRRQRSEVFSIELVLDGSMIFVQEGRRYRVMPGELFLVHQDRDNEFYPGPETSCHRLVCCLRGSILNTVLHSTKLFEHDVVKPANCDRVKTIMRQCFFELKEKRPEFRTRASVLAYELVLELGSHIKVSGQFQLVEKATGLMERHLSQRFRLKELAGLVGTSPTSLNRMFQTHYETSPINYFIDLKMTAAKSMLQQTDLQIQEVARRVGYDNSLYFSSEFRKRTGVSPRDYRKQVHIDALPRHGTGS